MTSTPVLHVDHVTRSFGDRPAVADVTLEVRAGQVVGLLGPNGAGKTTLLSMVSGLRTPDRGTVRVLGLDPRLPRNRAALGVTPQETGLPESLTAAEVVRFVADHHADPLPVREALDRFGIADLADRRCGGLSGGQQRRLACALALVGRPALVLLDEPTTGLDVEARHALWDGIRSHRDDGVAVLLTSHHLEEVEQLSDRVAVMAEGRVLVDDTLERVRDLVDVERLSWTGTVGRVAELEGVVDVRVDGDDVEVLARDADLVVRALASGAADFRRLRVRGASLEDAFTHLTAA
ncbi:MAG: ABC transporter ATP-binding protein [Propionibacteriales bacterium]|nr:ABC transporter ATP-binding protein [Propionibacteriales bacterium]